MKTANLVFPHQLFKDSPLEEVSGVFYLVEERLFFTQYKFHKQKIAFHRASMKFYESYLHGKHKKTDYIDATSDHHDIRKLIDQLAKHGVNQIHYIDVTDKYLGDYIEQAADEHGLKTVRHDSPLFLNTQEDLKQFFKEGKKSFHQTTFYKQQRKNRDILLEGDDDPQGGKWSYDGDNRKKYPAKKTPPNVEFPTATDYYKEAVEYVADNFSDHFGEVQDQPFYPHTHDQAEEWLENFLKERFDEFGPYEDAIVKEKRILNHSVLSPMINAGLLSPQLVLDRALEYGRENDIRINSIEGFVRQIIGWREFMRGMYEAKGTFMRNKNFFGFRRHMPASFYDGTTGIDPIDDTIKKVLKSGYNHHIERLMILGNFMLLCEIKPDHVYQWFMEMYIDAYDWVMVPNVYGMSQFADGGTFATKPYIGGSNYVKKMSNYGNGEWRDTWDGLFWNFMDKHSDFLGKNPRLAMLLGSWDKMDTKKRETHLNNAEKFLNKLKPA